ncbi:hypothetical protein D5400_09675 [Georhizobium profundi]|uniref:Uncharacterized protein n=1 Tax=Georhizobium profundi TaxID=2341112 RepID=A0A3S9B3H8_9HYPH|nr:hypothetical protein D5400_09675 [Georhizobium profundi]
MRTWIRSLLVLIVVAVAAATLLQTGLAASMVIEMEAQSGEMADMIDCLDCDEEANSMSCMTACITACPAILNSTAKADFLHRTSHEIFIAMFSLGVVRTPDPFPPRRTA